MANRQLTHEIYNALVAAYREKPEDHRNAAESAGVNWRTARRGWEQGWTPRLEWAPPIRDVIRGEQAAVRARLADEKAQHVKGEVKAAVTTPAALQPKAREDAIDARLLEARLVRNARGNAIALLEIIGETMKGVVQVVPAMKQAIAVMDPLRAVVVLQRLGALMRDATECGYRALQLERLQVGAPTEIIGVASVGMEDAERETRRTLALLEEAKKLGVIPSGEGAEDEQANGSGGNGSTPIVH